MDSFTVTRTLDAPREFVFQAWTDPASLGWFFSEVAVSTAPIEVDLRVGGAWRQEMIVGPGNHYVTGGVYLEITPPERLVFTWGATEGWPPVDDGLVATVTLTELGEQTEMRFDLHFPPQYAELGVREGWSETLDRLVRMMAR